MDGLPIMLGVFVSAITVSYTHLDVYKRQDKDRVIVNMQLGL